MSRMITMRIPHGEVWDKFREAVNKKYGKQLGTIGLENENLMIRFLIEEGYEEYKDSKYNGSNSQDTSENKSVSFFSEAKFSNKYYQALYEFLIQNDEDSIINFTVIKRFVNNTLGKLGRRTPHVYADAMADVGVIEPIQLTKKGKSAYKQYQILIGVSHHGEAMDKKGYSKSHHY